MTTGLRTGLAVLLFATAAGGAQAMEPVQVGRYSTLAPVPTSAQANPLAAAVQVTFPVRVRTVGDAADFLLSQSGYRLASRNAAMRVLLAQPLPGTQRSLGPLSLAQALETLAGRPYSLKVDPVGRLVGFELRPEFASFMPPEPTPAVIAPAAVAAAAEPVVPPEHPPAAAARPPAPAAPDRKPWRPSEDQPSADARPADPIVPVAVAQPVPFDAPQPVAAPAPEPAVAVASPVVLARLGPGTLSVVLDTWLRDRGWHLAWRSGADFRIDVPISLSAGTPPELLARLSELYGFPHCVFLQNQVVVVLQPGTNVREECRP